MAKLVFGCGYLGRRVARRWRQTGEEVFAVTRSAQRAEELRRDGLRPIVANVTRPETLGELPPVDGALFAVGYDRRGTASREAIHLFGLRAVLNALPPTVDTLIYISSTAVYGDAGAAWVDENTPCHPERESGKVLLAAEELLRSHPRGGQAIVLRLAGIYGPGRIPKLADLRAGLPLAVPEHGYLNLIHIDDAVAAVLAAETRGRRGATYNIADGHPALRRDFYRGLAALLDMPEPQFVEPPPDASAALRASTDKRIDNRRMVSELAIPLACPTYQEGLATIIAQEE